MTRCVCFSVTNAEKAFPQAVIRQKIQLSFNEMIKLVIFV